MADRDGDGVLDLATLETVGWQMPNLVRWWSWDGTTLVPSASSSPGTGNWWLRAADLTGDGRADLVTGQESDSTIQVAETSPSGDPGAFAARETVGDPELRFEVHGCDVDGDGDEDLLSTWRRYNDDGQFLAVVDNLGGGVLAAGAEQSIDSLAPSYHTTFGYPTDWDLDGDVDLLTGSLHLHMVENEEPGRFVFRDHWLTPSFSYGAGVDDLDEDGFPDFAGGRIVLYGDGQLSASFRGGVSASALRMEDLEGDGDLDLASAYSRKWFFNDGAGAFHEPPFPVTQPPGFLLGPWTSLGDFDADGRIDLLAERLQDSYPFFPFQGARFLRGSSAGGFEDAGPAAAPSSHVGNELAFDMPPLDMDGDSDLDVPTLDGWWENDGTGFFTAFHAAWTGYPRTGADVDGDLDVDLLTHTRSGNTTTIALQRNQGAGGFVAEILATESVAAGDLAGMAYLFDVDQDGDLEAAFGTTANGPRVLVFDNVGGSFTGPLELPGQDSGQPVLALADVDGDGLLDIVGGQRDGTAGTWLVWRRASTGFEPPRAYFAPVAQVPLDADQDGDVDVVGARVIRNRLFHGPGDGRARQYGLGTRGSGGATPVLGALGPLRPGSSSAALRIVRARGNSATIVRAGTGPARAGRGLAGERNLLIREPFFHMSLVLGGTPGAPGEGAADVSLTPVTIAMAGQALWLQAFILDPGARGGVASTNGLEVLLGTN